MKAARSSGIPIGQCPTCLATKIEVADGVWGWENGTYHYQGEEHECDCNTQMWLRERYLLANIGDQYQRLDWADYDKSEAVREAVALFLDKWESFKLNGMGLEFSSPRLGVGKTFAATHIGKELIKRGERVYFKPFLEIISLYTRENYEQMDNLLRDVTVLILDEVIPPISEAQGLLFSGKFEELIRHRTNFNRVTIMTTNLEPEYLNEHYPRTYSLLEAKQIRIEMTGDDVRQGRVAKDNLDLVINEEVRPIT